MNNSHPSPPSAGSLDGCRILILNGDHAGEEGICLGRAADGHRWAVSPNCSTAIFALQFESEFALLLDLSTAPSRN